MVIIPGEKAIERRRGAAKIISFAQRRLAILQYATRQNKVMPFEFGLILQEISTFEASFRMALAVPGNYFLLQIDA